VIDDVTDTLLCDAGPCDNNGTCVYVGGHDEFECQCADGFIGHLCQYRGSIIRLSTTLTRLGETKDPREAAVVCLTFYILSVYYLPVMFLGLYSAALFGVIKID